MLPKIKLSTIIIYKKFLNSQVARANTIKQFYTLYKKINLIFHY